MDKLELDKIKTFSNRIELARYLKKAGYKVGKSKIYEDVRAGKIKINSDGTITAQAAIDYARSLDQLGAAVMPQLNLSNSAKSILNSLKTYRKIYRELGFDIDQARTMAQQYLKKHFGIDCMEMFSCEKIIEKQHEPDIRDIIQDFIDERCMVGAGFKCPWPRLYDDYQSWCFKNRMTAADSAKFLTEIQSAFEYDVSGKVTIIKGLRLNG